MSGNRSFNFKLTKTTSIEADTETGRLLGISGGVVVAVVVASELPPLDATTSKCNKYIIAKFCNLDI